MPRHSEFLIILSSQSQHTYKFSAAVEERVALEASSVCITHCTTFEFHKEEFLHFFSLSFLTIYFFLSLNCAGCVHQHHRRWRCTNFEKEKKKRWASHGKQEEKKLKNNTKNPFSKKFIHSLILILLCCCSPRLPLSLSPSKHIFNISYTIDRICMLAHFF